MFRFAKLLLFALLLAGCGQPTVPETATFAPPTAIAATSTPTESPLPTATALSTQTPFIPPEQASAPPGSGFNDCSILTRAEAEGIVGEMSGDPFPLEWIGPEADWSGVCVHDGSLNTASFFIAWYSEHEAAQAHYTQVTTSGGESVDGIGEAASWNAEALTLSILQSQTVLSIEMLFPDDAQAQAIALARVAVPRLP